ncbi:MAG: BrnA antitoxin family protein [Mariprofundaceae bacterium]|nr:BrnA antitoxin family protein [Mariprofundaceae bacterium]
MNKPKQIPEFKSEAEEREFWETHNSTDYVNWEQAKPATFANLKPSTRAISIRMPQAMLEKIKVEANRRDVPYQSLIKVWLSERLDRAA